MEAKVIWLFAFVLMYWSYCVFWGIKGAIQSRTASDYMVAGRSIPLWVFVLAATATSFSGWTFVGHPGLIFRDGFQYAYASFYTITIPLTGVVFLKRQWMLGKRYGFVTPGEMLAEYFQGQGIRLLTVTVALFFSIPYLGLQLRASGFLFNVLTDGMLGVEVGMWMLSIVVFIYVASGGMKAVAYVDTMQCLLLAGGIVVLGIIGINQIGGIDALKEGIVNLVASDKNRTPDGYSHYIAIPGMIQFIGTGTKAAGGAWTGMMVLTYMFALMGIQSAPAFTMWGFGNKTPEPFAPQQVWASSFCIGFILFFFTAAQAFAAHLLGGNKVLLEAGLATNVMEINQWNAAGLFNQGGLVPHLINLVGPTAPWLVGLLAVCALAAMQSTGAAYMSTAGSMLTRDLYKHYINPDAGHSTQILFGRLGVAFIVGGALVVATVATDALVLLGGLAVAYGFQMWPALLGVCWFPWLTRQGVTWGLFFGIIAVTLTETIGQQITGGALPWGRWPWTMHSAGWGIYFNLGAAIIISAMTQNSDATAHRMKYHNFLQEHAGLPEEKKGLVPVAWIIVLLFFFFGIGPGAVIGNTFFGDPNDSTTWAFGIPSIWTWQIVWWVFGVFMMWFIAYKMELSILPHKEVEALTEDIWEEKILGKKP
ncbi:MAG: sodium:solute symporter family protein [SAR324 cluster bacterium]|nr:sodium:solute symporter family protein [SAR324 cluster bacterium]